MKIKYLAILLFLAVSGFGFKACKKDAPEPIVKVYADVQERTPRGVLIASQTGVSDVFKSVVDEELERLFADAGALNYVSTVNHSDYVLYAVPNCQLSPVSRTRSFLIRADVYDGTIYDQDPKAGVGRIYAAELVAGDGRGGIADAYVVCDTPTVDQDLRDAIRFGPEHIILKRNNEGEFWRTWYHGNGIAHPLIASTDSAPRRRTVKTDVVDFAAQIQIQVAK